MRPARSRSREVVLQRQLLLADRRARQRAAAPAADDTPGPPQQGAAGTTTELWHELAEREVALCRRDRQQWAQAMDRADVLQAQGLPPMQAVRQALDETGA